VNDAREAGLRVLLGLADRKAHRGGRSILAAPANVAAVADDLGYAGLEVFGYIVVVLVPVRFWHQHFHVFADDLASGIAEQLFTGWIEHLYNAACVDQDNTVDRCFDQRAHPRGTLSKRSFG